MITVALVIIDQNWEQYKYPFGIEEINNFALHIRWKAIYEKSQTTVIFNKMDASPKLNLEQNQTPKRGFIIL